MCLVRIFTTEHENEPEVEPLYADIEQMECRDDGLLITELLGPSTFIPGRVSYINFLEGKVFIETGATPPQTPTAPSGHQ